MKEVVYTEHLKIRLTVRKIPYDYPHQIYMHPEQEYYDNIEKRKIAIKRLYYNDQVRPMMIAIEEKEERTEIVTIHPIHEEKIINRIMSRRWTHHEP